MLSVSSEGVWRVALSQEQLAQAMDDYNKKAPQMRICEQHKALAARYGYTATIVVAAHNGTEQHVHDTLCQT